MARAHMKSNATDDPSPLGFYNFAVSYHMAADLVVVGGLKATHPESVAMFLYYHAIELYLKSFLRLWGDTAKRLRKIGHDFQTLHSLRQSVGKAFYDAGEPIRMPSHRTPRR
jgi:hypothetical protein